MDRTELQKVVTEHTLFTTKLHELMESLLMTSKIKYHAIEHRTKTVESLEEKIGRKKIEDMKIKEKVMDISGIRIILYYQEDVDKVVDLIKTNFTIDKKNSINKADLYNSNEFGYLSVHYIITLDNKRNKLPEWKTFSKLKAEIQVRTVLQHSWASISHELTYKKKYEIPNELKRKLYRLAGLFELADEQFLKIKEEHNAIYERIKNQTLTEKEENSEINLLTLKYALEKESRIIDTLEKIAIEAGFQNVEREIKSDSSYLSDIALLSDILGYKFVNEIEENLQLKIESLKLYFREIVKDWTTECKKEVAEGFKEYYLFASIIFLLNSKQLMEFSERNDSNWNIDFFVRVKNTISNLKMPNA